jgi:aryl-alcohol dehydrogenase-like predicted oxidoreductase
MMFGLKTLEPESIAMIEHALERGVNFIDTANVYACGDVVVARSPRTAAAHARYSRRRRTSAPRRTTRTRWATAGGTSSRVRELTRRLQTD